MKYEVVAVDFDGTICENAFPEIGKPNKDVINYVKQLSKDGSKIILHTCREDGERRKLLTEAVRFCQCQSIPLYAVNENPDNIYSKIYKTSKGRKVYADLYIDDKAVNPKEITGNKKLVFIIYVLLQIISILIFILAKDKIAIQRGYEAVGGEACILLLPLICFLSRNINISEK